MSDFLLNMINRHQGAVDTVQPRRKSIFEPEPMSGAVGHANFNRAKNEAAEKRVLNNGLAAGVSSASAIEKPIANDGRTETLNTAPPSAQEQFEARSEISRRSFPDEHFARAPANVVREPAVVPNLDAPNVVTPLSTGLSPEGMQQLVASNKHFTMAESKEPENKQPDLRREQIQNVLDRLSRQAAFPESADRSNEPSDLASPTTHASPDSRSVVNETAMNAGIETALRRLQAHIHFAKDDQHGTDHPAKANDRAQPVSAIADQSGSLQTPAWLTAMNNHRFRNIQAQARAEPVVNVTIGRVEVRAVNTEAAKPAPDRQKPKGVMSLDDYLKRRESGGRK